MPETYIKHILSANVYDAAVETPLQEAKFISARLGNKVLIKREDLQPIHSFKIRGAYNKMRQLDQSLLDKGVIAASAGNHAQGVALAAKQLNCSATIVMPVTTPAIKVNGVRHWGGNVVLHGDTYDEAASHARQLVEEKGMTYIHPYDDKAVIAGQGTIAVEILKQYTQPIDICFVPVGGGGLAAGIAAYMKYVKPSIKIVAVEPDDAACLKAAMAQEKPVVLPEVGLFADGVAVARIGEETFRVLKQTIDAVVTVSTDEICNAIKDIFEDTRSIAEPAGAIALAGLKKYANDHQLRDETLVAIESGANTNFDRLRYICERSYSGERREALFSVEIAENPGSFKKFCSVLGKRSITEFNYRFTHKESAQIFVGIQLGNDEPCTDVVMTLKGEGYRVADLTDNDMAKEHVRHMVGGRSVGVDNEVVYAVEFPERPGALMRFLDKLGAQWNISMFHYRNHGAAWGRVLVGLQVMDTEKQTLTGLLEDLGYPFVEETENLAYVDFLKG